MYKEILESMMAELRSKIYTLRQSQMDLMPWRLLTYNRLEGQMIATKVCLVSLEKDMRLAQNQDLSVKALMSKELQRLHITRRFVMGETYVAIAETLTGGDKDEMKYATTVGLRLTSEHTAPDCKISYNIKSKDARANRAIWLPRIDETIKHYGGTID